METFKHIKKNQEILFAKLPDELKKQILDEEEQERKINKDIQGKPVKICNHCFGLKHQDCFNYKYFYQNVCNRCHILQKAEAEYRIVDTLYCEVCDCNLVLSNKHQKKFIIRNHESTQKHIRNLNGHRKN